MNGITGLSAIAGFQVTTNENSQATPEQRYGGTADPRHGKRGEQARPYPWEARVGQGMIHGPYGPENQLLGDEFWFMEPAGDPSQDPYFDHTPSRRAAPFPKGINSGVVPAETPEFVNQQRAISAEIHGTRTNAGARSLTILTPQQDEWVELYEINPGHSDQMPIPKQMMSSGFMWGTRDRVQSMAAQNQFGFDSAHMHRRYAAGSIPGNTMWMQPGGRPLRKTLAGPGRPAIGPDSPFSGQDLGLAFSPNGAILQNVPTEYVAPATPRVASPESYSPPGDVEWY